MTPSYYKSCSVPQCGSTTIKTPNKLFIHLPHNPQMRKQWLTLARRKDAHCLSTKSTRFFCEDHFDLQTDMLNYTEYRIMGKISQTRMRPGCLPTKFACQEERRKRTCVSTDHSYAMKRQSTILISDLLEEEESCITKSQNNIPHTSSDTKKFGAVLPEMSCAQKSDKCIQTDIKCEKIDKSIQVLIKNKFRSKAIQCKIKTRERATSPLVSSMYISTSPFYVEDIRNEGRNIGVFVKEEYDSDNYEPSETNSSLSYLQVKSTECTELISEEIKLETEEILLDNIVKIENPLLYPDFV